MNKARITYRFDPNRDNREREAGQGTEEMGRVIPLYQEEYEVVEEELELRGPSYKGDKPDRERTMPGSAGRDTNKGQAPDIRDYQGLNQFTTDFGAWSSPFDAETRRIEELIREASEREAIRHSGQSDSRSRTPRQDREEERFPQQSREYPEQRNWSRSGQAGFEAGGSRQESYWPEEDNGYEDRLGTRGGYAYSADEPSSGRGYRPEQDNGWEGPIVTGPRYVRHNRTPWLKISAAVAGAAVTGVLLGVLALSLFSNSDPADVSGNLADPQAGAGVNQNVKPVSGVIDSGAAGAVSGAAASGKEISLAYGGKSYSILQNGIFSAQQGAEQAKSDLVKQGLAAASEAASGKFYVFTGISMDKESAAALSKQLKEKNKLDIYVKEYSVPAVSKVRWNGNGDTLKSYLEQSDKLLQSINLLSVMNLEAAKPEPIDASTLQSVSTAHAAWAQQSTTVSQEAGEDTKGIVQKMNAAMNSAKASLDEYKKNPSAAMLWQAQTYALQFVVAQKELLTKIGS